MDVSIRFLRYFVATAECGSVTSAATKLNISQPSVSAAIAQLEADLDMQLLVRRPSRGVMLTPQGSEVLRAARELIERVEQFRAATGAVNVEMRGELSIACFINLGATYLGQLIRSFGEKYPNVDILFQDIDQQDIFSALTSGRVELALTFDLDLPSGLDATIVAQRPAMAILAENDPLTRRKTVTMEALSERPFVLMDLPHTCDYFLSLFTAKGLSPNIRHRTRSFETVRSLVGNGLGVSILNLEPKTPITYDGCAIVTRPITGSPKPLQVVILTPQRLRQRRLAQAFTEHISDYFSAPSGSPVH